MVIQNILFFDILNLTSLQSTNIDASSFNEFRISLSHNTLFEPETSLYHLKVVNLVLTNTRINSNLNYKLK